MEENKEIKELEIGKDTISNGETKRENTEKKEDNSFYESGTVNKDGSSWLTDWRGKTLGFIIVFLILIGIAIPSGMAIAGYFKDKLKTPDFSNDDEIQKISNDIKVIKNEATIFNYDALYNQGYINKYAYDKNKDLFNNQADDQIKNEKDDLKSQFGNTWETEWNKSLNDKGFDSEGEYKDSILASKYSSEVAKKYTARSKFTSKDIADDGSHVFVSNENTTKGRFYFISNDADIKEKLNSGRTEDEWTTITDTWGQILSPEDLLKMYIYIYEPVVFNSSVLGFSPLSASGEASVDVSRVELTKDNLKAFLHYKNAKEAGSYEPNSTNEGGIQSRYNTTLSEAGKAALLESNYSAPTNGAGIDALMTAALPADATATTIDALSTSELDDLSKQFSTALTADGAIGGANRTFSFVENNDGDKLAYLDTDGIHIVGLQDQATATYDGKDITVVEASLVTNALDILNKSDDYLDLVDTGLFDSYSSWVNTNIKNITTLKYYKEGLFKGNDIIDPDGDGKIGSDDGDFSKEEDIKAYINTQALKYTVGIYTDQYYGVTSFSDSNEGVFNLDEAALATLKTNAQSFNLYQLTHTGATTPSESVVAIKGGDDDE